MMVGVTFNHGEGVVPLMGRIAASVGLNAEQSVNALLELPVVTWL